MHQPLPLKIAGVGRYLPKRIVTNDEIEKMAGLPEGFVERTAAGVRERRWVDDETNSFMGAEAAREALQDAGMDAEDIDLILNASGSQEQAIPDGGPLIQRHLGLNGQGTPAMSVHCTCLSFLAALNIAANFIATGQYRNILIISSEISSCGINPKEYESFVLFGDVGTAVVVTAPSEQEPSRMDNYIFRTFSEGAFHTCIMGGGTKRHPNKSSTTFEDNLFQMKGKSTFKVARKYASETFEMLQPGLSTGLNGVSMVVPHQASGLAMRVYQKFGWPKEQIAVTLDWLGNCIAASIPATLYDVVREERIQRGEKLLFVGTGAGLSIGASVVTY